MKGKKTMKGTLNKSIKKNNNLLKYLNKKKKKLNYFLF
jgi:hypothetical protein